MVACLSVLVYVFVVCVTHSRAPFVLLVLLLNYCFSFNDKDQCSLPFCSIQYILSQIDNCIQYGEDADVKVKDFDPEEDD